MPSEDFRGDGASSTFTTDGSQLSERVMESIRSGALAGLSKGIGHYAQAAREAGTLDFSAPVGHISFDQETMTPARQAEIDKAKIKEGDPNDPDLKEKLKHTRGFPLTDGAVSESELKERIKHMTGNPLEKGNASDPDVKDKVKHMHGFPASPEVDDKKR